MDELRCTSCGSANIIEDKNSGELVCGDCGHVLDRIIYSDPEWRAYSYGDRVKRERAGAPITPLLHDLGLSTRYRKNSKINSDEERTMIAILSEIYRISSSLNIPQSAAQAAAIFLRKLGREIRSSRKFLRALPASLIYLSLKVHGIPRDLKEVAEISGLEQKTIRRCYLKLAESLKVRSLTDVDVYISKMVKILGLPGEVEHLANDIYKKSAIKGLTQGKNTKAIAAAATYLAARTLGISISQRRLVKEVGVSKSTLRRRLREFEAVLSDENIRKESRITLRRINLATEVNEIGRRSH